MSRCDSAAMVPNTSDDLPEPETPVKTVSRRLGISTEMFLRLLTRAPWTRMRSCRSAGARSDLDMGDQCIDPFMHRSIDPLIHLSGCWIRLHTGRARIQSVCSSAPRKKL